MHISSLIVVFICVWWLVFFMALPFGVTRAEGGPEETAHGAPEKPLLKKKAMITTLITVVLTGIIYGLVVSGLVDFYGIASQWAEEDYQ